MFHVMNMNNVLNLTNDEKQTQTEICATKPTAGEIYRFPSRVKNLNNPVTHQTTYLHSHLVSAMGQN
jgi:hypothetical protein